MAVKIDCIPKQLPFMKSSFLLFCLTVSTFLHAQYSHISDRRFFEPNELVGYDFKPGAMEIRGEMEKRLGPGEYSFGITFNNLFVKGEGIQGVYNINNMMPQEYGFKLLLMNARDARLQGHLKVILNKYSMVEALIFKRSPDDKEIIFYQLPLTKEKKGQEKAYFTDRGETIVEHKDSIWGTEIHPFLIVHESEKVQQRLQMADSTYISFTEEVTIVEKEIKKKGKKGKQEATANEEGTAPETQTDTTLNDAPEVKVKITKEHFITVFSYIKNADGAREIISKKYPVKRVVEKEDESAGMQEERFLWEFINDKKERINLYLNGDRTISSMEIGDKKYMMRGF